MRTRTWIIGLALLGSTGCSCMSNTEKGVLGGAAVGTGLGAIAGRGHPGAMLVGGLLGTAVGGIAGSEQDRREDRRAYDRAYNHAQVAQAQRQMSVPEVIQLSQQKTPDNLIIGQINSTGSVFNLTSNDILDMRNHGVSDQVISTMQNRRYARPVVVGPPAVVFVEPPPPPPPHFGVGVVIGR